MPMKKLVSLFGQHSALFDELNQRAEAYAKERDIEYIWAPQECYDASRVAQLLRDADAGLVDVEPYGEDIFQKIHTRCKLLIRFGVGYDKVDLSAATKYGICATRTSGANSMSVAEMALGMILALRRQHRQNRQVMESGVWKKPVGTETYGKVIGIWGFGAIGQRLAQLLKGFDCKVLACDPYPDKGRGMEFGVEFVDLETLFTQCDAISIHAPYCAQTHHAVGKTLLEKMKADAVLVCTARGNIVDEDALYEALLQHRIAGAGLDVFGQEPLPASSKLLTLDNLILTPHVSSNTTEALMGTLRKAIDITTDFYAGRPLLSADLLNPDYSETATVIICNKQ